MTTDEIIKGLDRLSIPNDITDAAKEELERFQQEVGRLKQYTANLEATIYAYARGDGLDVLIRALEGRK